MPRRYLGEAPPVVELPAQLADDKETIKAAFVSLKENIERWVSQHIGQNLDKAKLIWDLTKKRNTMGVPPMTRTFGMPHTSESINTLRSMFMEFWSTDQNVFVCLWIMKLLEEQFFSRYYTLGFTMVEEGVLEANREAFLNGNPNGDLDFCQWREFWTDEILAANAPRDQFEKEQLNERIGQIIFDLQGNLTQITGGCMTDLIESILRPAYALLRAMQSSRTTAFHLTWPWTSYRQEQSPEELAQFTVRNIMPGVGPETAGMVFIINDLYPALEVHEYGQNGLETLEPAVILAR